MVAAINAGLDFFRQVLALRAYRQEILSADIANASTPGFKAVDLDFSGALADATRPPLTEARPTTRNVWLVDDARQFSVDVSGANPAEDFVKYQADAEVTLDGNSVDLNKEKTTAAENGVQYEAAATFATQTIRMLAIAINGSPQSSGS